MDLSVLIVSYKTPALTRDCLRSVYAETTNIAFEVIVVENASHDGTAEMVAAEFPQARLVALDENIGFARGNNLAAARARGEYVVLLNPDTVVRDRALEQLLDFARRNPSAGAYGGRTLDRDGEMDPRSCSAAPSLWATFCFASGLSTAFRGHRLLDPEAIGGYARDSVRSVGVIVGCLLLMRRDLWDELGGFDADFYMYGEDVDLSLRLDERGLQRLITPDATITHLIGGSSASSGGKMTQIVTSRVTIMRKHWSSRRQVAGVALLSAGVALRAALSLLTGRGAQSTWPVVWRERRAWRRGFAITPAPRAPG